MSTPAAAVSAAGRSSSPIRGVLPYPTLHLFRVEVATGADGAVLDSLATLADLTRVQWVSPTAARMLVETGCESAAELAAADPDALCEALERVNEGDRHFKGKIGLRDVTRLVHSAGYVAGPACW